MDPIVLAQKMKRLQVWLDRECRRGVQQISYAGPPFGQAYVSIDPASQAIAASGNFNRINLCGAEAGLDAAGLNEMIGRFRREGIDEFFVWLSPGPDMNRVRTWLKEAGFSQGPWTRYPTLQLLDQGKPALGTALEIREVGAAEVALARAELGATILWESYETCAGKPGFHHFMAFDDSRPVAIAALAVFEDIGYLGWMATREQDRRRGAQQALIAARIGKAQSLGCSVIVSETLTMLKSSLGNLQRAGLREVFEKEVYGLSAS